MPKNTAQGFGLRSGLSLLIAASIGLALTSLLGLIELPYALKAATDPSSLEGTWLAWYEQRARLIYEFLNAGSTLLMFLGVTRLYRALGGALYSVALVLLLLGSIGALLRFDSASLLLLDLLKSAHYPYVEIQALYHTFSQGLLGLRCIEIVGLGVLVFAVVERASPWLPLLLGVLLIELAGQVLFYLQYSSAPGSSYPWYDTLMEGLASLVFCLVFSLLVRRLLQARDSEVTASWGEPASGVKAYARALWLWLALLLAVILIEAVMASRAKATLIALFTTPLLLAALVTRWFMLLGLTRFTEAPAKSGVRGWTSASLLLQCFSFAADISLLLFALRVFVEKSIITELSRYLPQNSLLANLSSAVGLFLLVFAFRRAAQSMGDSLLAKRASSLLWMMGLLLLGLASLWFVTGALLAILGFLFVSLGVVALSLYLRLLKDLGERLTN